MVVSIILYGLRANIQHHVIALLYRYELAIVIVASTWRRQSRRRQGPGC